MPKILIVDDSKYQRNLISEIIQSADLHQIDIIEAKNGNECLEYIENDSTINVVLLDLNMPGSDGLEILRKSNESNSNIKFIVVTSNHRSEAEKSCHSFGVFDFMIKPIQPDELIISIKKALELLH